MSEMSMHATMRAEPIADDFDPQTDALGAQVVDHGELDAGTRRVLLQLIRGPYLREATHQKLWPALVRDEEVVRSRLADLYLDLVVDHGSGIAFVRNQPTAWATFRLGGKLREIVVVVQRLTRVIEQSSIGFTYYGFQIGIFELSTLYEVVQVVYIGGKMFAVMQINRSCRYNSFQCICRIR